MSGMLQKVVEEGLNDEDSVLQKPYTLDRKSNVHATLHIHVDAMSKENIDKLFKACKLLNEAGVAFDTGFGCGDFDWELDHSLKGAHLSLRKVVE